MPGSGSPSWSKDWLLISDIDGTLTGDDAALEKLMRRLAERRHTIGFGVASGRSPTLVRQAMDRFGLNEPDIVIASVGTEMMGPGGLGELYREHVGVAWDRAAVVGALEGVMADAVARAASLPAADVRRATQIAGSLSDAARAALSGGADALSAFSIQLFRPLQPMLASPAEDVADAMTRLGEAALDYKLDGARVQVHRSGDDVRVFTRGLNDITDSVPELVESVRVLPVKEVVLDGEAIALREDGTPAPFQVTMARFGSRVDVDRLRKQTPLTTLFFDMLHVDGRSLLDDPAVERFSAMRDMLPEPLIIPRLITSDTEAAAAFMKQAKAAGHEGIVAKSLDAGYDAGRRGRAWLKVKVADTLDLVVLAAEWGNGRRQGWLSNLHLGARNPHDGGFVMLGKTFKGLTDTLLEWQTHELLAREIGREGHIVHVRPELVVEIAFEGVQKSSRYPGGVALRFARVRRYRSDKTAAHADTIDRVRAIHQSTT